MVETAANQANKPTKTNKNVPKAFQIHYGVGRA